MGLITYECARAEYSHEIRQFNRTMQYLYDYFDGRDETALFIGNVNLGDINLDGLLVKEDAIVIIEFKDYVGNITARMNGQWECNGQVIKGGAGVKSVFEQAKKNRRILKKIIAENQYFTESQRNDIQCAVVFAKIDSLNTDFDRDTNGWLHVSDEKNIGNAIHLIKSRNFDDYKTKQRISVNITLSDICDFLVKFNIDERMLVTDFSDVSLLTGELYNEDFPHNGKYKSTATMLKQKEQEVDGLNKQVTDFQLQLRNLEAKLASQTNTRDAIINKQQAELIAVKESILREQKQSWEDMQNQTQNNQQQLDFERQKAEFEEREKDLLSQIINLKEEILQNNTLIDSRLEQHIDTVPNKSVAPRFSVKPKPQKDFMVDSNNLDADQIDLIDKTIEQSMIVSGCAGSGKSLIALNKAIKIKEGGGDVILIAYTKSLNRYMRTGIKEHQLSDSFYYHWQWKKKKMPTADYIIVDEIQDFTRQEIEEFINASRKQFFFFGDSAQSIYNFTNKKTLSIDDISDMTGIKPLYLYNNYRLPNTIAQITQSYVGVNVDPYAEKVYKSKEQVLPHIISYNNIEEQVDAIIRIASKNVNSKIGILVHKNQDIIQLMDMFIERKFVCEFKYSQGISDEERRDNLNFKSSIPKMMTYHSAKGLQFETVILPLYSGAISDNEKRALYVAMTRTYRNLYVLFDEVLQPPLSKIPTHLYSKRE